MEGQNINDLIIPEQNLATLSFCEATPHAIQSWVDGLPKANIGETARQLYHAVIELNQLIIAPQIRIQLLEIVRPAIHYACQELSKHFLNQPIILPEKQRKIANLTQAIQIHLATGYKIVVIESIEHPHRNDKLKKQLTCACHRLISELGETILRASQLYCPSPKRAWLELHIVYTFAEQQGINHYPVKDTHKNNREDSSIADAYKQILLLGCCKPNQLRQSDLSTAYRTFEAWAPLVDIGQQFSTSSVFIIDTQSDSAPFYRSLVSQAITDQHYGLDTKELVEKLNNHLSQMGTHSKIESDLPLPMLLQDQLLAHLSQALGILTKRNFKRIPSRGKLQICVGLSATHYFISGEVEFNTLLMSELIQTVHTKKEEAAFSKKTNNTNDAWSNAFDAAPVHERTFEADTAIHYDQQTIQLDNTHKPIQFHYHQVPLINTSPGGYCLQWEGDIPDNVQTGEILAIRERENHYWSIAVIRWIRQIKQKGTQLGIELLAPSATPCGVQLVHKTGGQSEYLRGLLLPEIAAIKQPTTLIVPRIPFQTGNRVMINLHGNETKNQLIKRTTATGSFSQFEVKSLSGPLPIENTDTSTTSSSDDEFDSLWPSL